jgi:mono/diheme cytochrome c family protein
MRRFLFPFGLAVLAATSIQAANVAAGKAAYNKSCKGCHGADGMANPAVAKMMKVEIKDLKSPDVQGMSDADLEKVITEGKGKMKPVSSAASSAADIAAYIHTMK